MISAPDKTNKTQNYLAIDLMACYFLSRGIFYTFAL